MTAPWEELLAVWRAGRRRSSVSSGGWVNDHLYNPFYPTTLGLAAGVRRLHAAGRPGAGNHPAAARHDGGRQSDATSRGRCPHGRDHRPPFERAVRAWASAPAGTSASTPTTGSTCSPSGPGSPLSRSRVEVITSLLNEKDRRSAASSTGSTAPGRSPSRCRTRIPIVIGASGEQRCCGSWPATPTTGTSTTPVLRSSPTRSRCWSATAPRSVVTRRRSSTRCSSGSMTPSTASETRWSPLRDVGAEHAVVSLRRPDPAVLEAVAEALAEV